MPTCDHHRSPVNIHSSSHRNWMPSSSPRLTVAEAERIRSTFYTWQRDAQPRMLNSSIDDASPSRQLVPQSSLSAVVMAAESILPTDLNVSTKQPTQRKSSVHHLPSFESVNDVDSFLFDGGHSSHSLRRENYSRKTDHHSKMQTPSSNVSSSPVRTSTPNRTKNSVWAHRASVQGILPQQTAELKTAVLSYNSPQHLERSLEAQLAHVGRVDAALEAKRFKHAPSTPRRWL